MKTHPRSQEKHGQFPHGIYMPRRLFLFFLFLFLFLFSTTLVFDLILNYERVLCLLQPPAEDALRGTGRLAAGQAAVGHLCFQRYAYPAEMVVELFPRQPWCLEDKQNVNGLVLT